MRCVCESQRFKQGLEALLFSPVTTRLDTGCEDAALERKLQRWRLPGDPTQLPCAARRRGLAGKAQKAEVCRARLCHFERYWHRPGPEEPDSEPEAPETVLRGASRPLAKSLRPGAVCRYLRGDEIAVCERWDESSNAWHVRRADGRLQLASPEQLIALGGNEEGDDLDGEELTLEELQELDQAEAICHMVHITCSWSQERWRLIDAIDHQLCLKEAVKLCGVDLPAGSQLVDDVGGGFSGMDAFLRTGMDCAGVLWSDYWETFCGCSPDHLIQGSLLYTVCGLVICLVLFFTRYFAEGIWGLLLILVLASPAIGLKAFPEHALEAPERVCSQCLLPRKLHSMRRISLCFTVVLMLLLSSFISVSLSALVKGDLKPPHLSEQTFQFPPFGQMNPWSPENFTAAPCTMFYGTTDDTVALPLVDFALFNKLVYMPDESLRKHNRDWLPHWELVYEQRRERRCSPKDGDCDVGDWTSWFVFQGLRGSKLEDTMVVTIRGTKTPLDYILDLDLWP
eukprot:g18635.t1